MSTVAMLLSSNKTRQIMHVDKLYVMQYEHWP